MQRGGSPTARRRRWADLVAASVLAASSTAAAEEPDSTASADTAPPESDDYPTAYVERPLTLPALMTQATLRAAYHWVEDDENRATTLVRGDVGLTGWWQASAWTTWRVAPDRAWSQAIGLASRALVLDTARVDLTLGLSAPLVLDGDRDTAAVPWLTLDGYARVRVFRRSAVYLGHDLATVGLGDDSFASIDLHAGFVSQLSDHLALQFWAHVLHVRVAGDIPESGGPYLPGVTFFLSPASWLDVWVGGYSGSTSDGVSAGVSARI